MDDAAVILRERGRERDAIPPGVGARDAVVHLEKVILDGLRHGFFECSISCEIGSGGRRHLVIRSGKSHKFTIPETELPR
jgi:hypothetical protein